MMSLASFFRLAVSYRATQYHLGCSDLINVLYFRIYFCGVSQDMEYYNKLEDPTDEENDMLDLAFALTDTYVSCFVLFSSSHDL